VEIGKEMSGVWKTESGEVVRIKNMDDGHLLNTISMLQNKHLENTPSYKDLLKEAKKRKILNAVKVNCTYCGVPAKKVTGGVIYPHRPDLFEKVFFHCQECKAYVGAHKSGRPLGTLAKENLRKLRSFTHSILDPLWQSGEMSRNEVYQNLAKDMGIPQSKCHIGQFNESQCNTVVKIISEWLGTYPPPPPPKAVQKSEMTLEECLANL
jgi:hypothetical protein